MESMSGAENLDTIGMWRILKTEAPMKATKIIDGISGFESMDPDTQIATLETYINETLVHENKNRYLAREIARIIEQIRAKVTYENRMRALAA